MIKFNIEFYKPAWACMIFSCMWVLLLFEVNGQSEPVRKYIKPDTSDSVFFSANPKNLPQPMAVMNINASITDAFCTGSSDGSMQVQIASSDLPFTYYFEGNFIGKAYGSYWRMIEINNPGLTLNQFQIRVVVPELDKANSDFSDIRFSDSSMTTLYSHWYEEVRDGDAAFWVKLPVIPSGKSYIKVFYGNSAATGISNGYSSFEYFDDFEDGVYSDWSSGCAMKSNASETCNVNLINKTGTGNYLHLEGYADCIGPYSAELQTSIFRHITLSPGTYRFDYSASLTSCLHSNCSGKTEVMTFSQLDGNYHSEYIYYIDQEGSCNCKSTRWFQSRSEQYTDNGNGHQYKIISEFWDCSNEGTKIDNIRIRKSVANPPSVTVGPEQSIRFENLKAGEYALKAKNSSGEELVKIIHINEPALPNADTAFSCGPGNIDFKVSGTYTSYKWYDANDIYIGQSDTIYSISHISTTTSYYLTGIGSNGCESSPKVSATAKIKERSKAGSISSDKKSVCVGDSVKLTVNDRIGNVLGWEISFDSINFNKQYTGILDTSFTLVPLKGKTFIKSITRNEGCTPDTTDVYVIEVHMPSFAFITGTDTILPNEKTDAIKLVNLNGGILEWQKSYDPFFNSYSVIDGTSSGMVDSNLASTSYYRVKVKSGVCPALYSNITSIRVNRVHKPYSDTAMVVVNSELWDHPGLLYNDIDPDGDQLVIKENDWLKTRNNGKIKFNQNGTFYYAPAYNYSGLDSVNYTVCDKHQEHLKHCVTSKLVIIVEEVKPAHPAIHVFNAISPNGDNSNDSWIIQGIEYYPENEVFIYDRYGNLVFKERGYDNSEDKKWKGTANEGILAEGQYLPSGTYFYLININGSEKQLSGYIELHR